MSVINLGLIQAIFPSNTAPVNTAILWYDTNPGQFVHKYYDVNTATWTTLAPASGAATWGLIAGTIGSQTDLINYIAGQINNLKGSVPTALNTLEKIASAINNNANFYTDILALITAKASTTDPRFPSLDQKAALAGTSGTPGASNPYVTYNDPSLTNARVAIAHKASHEAGGSDELTGNLNANARIRVLLEGLLKGTRRGINFIQGDGISMSITDDSVNEKIDITITNTGGGGGGGGTYTDEMAQDAVGNALADTNSIAAAYTDSAPSFSFSLRRKTTGLSTDKIALSEDIDGIFLQGGTSANQAALGNDSRFPTTSEKEALVGDGSFAPSSSNPFTTVNYVLNALNGLRWKQPAKAATVANITLSGAQTIDGIALIAGERCLVKDQTDATQNGIYIVAAGSWTRSLDSDTPSELYAAAILVQEGTVNADGLFQQTTDTITIGVSNIVWTGFGSAIYNTDGQGIEISGTTITLEIDGNSLSKSGSGIKVKLKSASLTSAEGLITETSNGLVVTLGSGANEAAPGNHTHNSDQITEGATNLYFTAARAIASVLTGLAAASGTLAATDTILQAFNKVKYFIDNFNSTTRTISATTGWIFSEFTTFTKGIVLSAFTNSTPSEGQVWIEGFKLKARVNGVTVTLLDSLGNLSELNNIQTGRQNIGFDYETATVAISSNIATWDFLQSGVQKAIDTIDISSISADFALNISNSGITGIAKLTKNTASAVTVSLGGAGLTHKDSETTISALILPAGAIGDEYFLTFYRFGSNIYWITRDGQIVQTLSYSTTDIPSVGLLRSELDLRFKQGGNTYGAAISFGTLDANDVAFFVNGTANERLILQSTGARLTGAVTFRTTGSVQTFNISNTGLAIFGTGSAHSTLQSGGSFAKFLRSISALRTLDATDCIILATGTYTVTLPTAVGISGRQYMIANVGTGVISIATTSSQTINGVTTDSLFTQYALLVLISDGANWIIQSRSVVVRKRKATAIDYTVVVNEVMQNGIVAVTDTTAVRTITLPAANAVREGFAFSIKDEYGTAGTNNITIARAGSDTIDGATSALINTNYGSRDLYSDGISKWFIL